MSSVCERKIVTTEEMMQLLACGYTVRLPSVMRPSDDVLSRYDDVCDAWFADDAVECDVYDTDLQPVALNGVYGFEIASVEEVGEEEVQCIEVDAPHHMYLTSDFIATHNTSNIIFLKSTDDSLLDTLQKMSGIRHQTYTDSKMITRDIEKIFMRNEGKASYTMSTKEEPVISYNDMAFIAGRNSIVFRAGDSPIWNRNETILPMSWRLFSTKITQPGKDYTLQTIPTLSTAIDFDVRRNQPDFSRMLKKRIAQAIEVEQAEADFKEAFGYSDYEIEQLDPDVYANQIMDIVNKRIAIANAKAEEKQKAQAATGQMSQQAVQKPMTQPGQGDFDSANFDALLATMPVGEEHRNIEQEQATAKAMKEEELSGELRFAGGKIAPNDLVVHGAVNRGLEGVITSAYAACANAMLSDRDHFTPGSHKTLLSRDGLTPYILSRHDSEHRQMIEAAMQSDSSKNRVYAEDDIRDDELNSLSTYFVTDAFFKYLASLPSWVPLADGQFERRMALLVGDEF